DDGGLAAFDGPHRLGGAHAEVAEEFVHVGTTLEVGPVSVVEDGEREAFAFGPGDVGEHVSCSPGDQVSKWPRGGAVSLSRGCVAESDAAVIGLVHTLS